MPEKSPRSRPGRSPASLSKRSGRRSRTRRRAAPAWAAEPRCGSPSWRPISWRVPPRHYGPWELFASLLTEGLVARGHDVTLFATGDSLTSARLRSRGAARAGRRIRDVDPKVAECLHIAEVFEQAAEFDIIHNSFDFLPLTYSGLVDTPVVTTIHGFSSRRRSCRSTPSTTAASAYVAISDADRHPALDYVATIHHGIDIGAFAFQAVRRGATWPSSVASTPTRAWSKPSTPPRRPACPLKIAGIIQDQEYFDTAGGAAPGRRRRASYIGPGPGRGPLRLPRWGASHCSI